MSTESNDKRSEDTSKKNDNIIKVRVLSLKGRKKGEILNMHKSTAEALFNKKIVELVK